MSRSGARPAPGRRVGASRGAPREVGVGVSAAFTPSGDRLGGGATAGAGEAHLGIRLFGLRLFGRLPAWLASAARDRRRHALEAAVPEALDVLRATVAGGAGPANGLAAAAETATGPLAEVLDRAVRACALGVPPGRALAEAGAAAGLAELTTAGEALELAATTGAPPGPVLAGVARAAADRVRARHARLAATAGSRLSVRVLASLGPGFVALLVLTTPEDVAFLVREPAGWGTLALAFAFEAAGLLWSRHILEDGA
jgi:Flp pilus assembly protein TadB